MAIPPPLMTLPKFFATSLREAKKGYFGLIHSTYYYISYNTAGFIKKCVQMDR